MRDYSILAAAFGALTSLLLFVVTRWYRHAIRLSERYDIAERRRVAARHYIFVVLLLFGLIAGTLLPLIRYIRVPSPVIAFGFLLAVAPGGICWLRRLPTLKALGYGRQPSHPTNVA